MTTVTKDAPSANGTRTESAAVKPTGNLWTRIAALQAEAGNIPKKGKAPREMGGFEFVRDTDVSDAARELYARHGIAYCPPHMVSQTTEQVAETERGKPLYRTTVRLRFRLRNIDAPDEVEEWEWEGLGDDLHDKGVSKAATSAVKATLTKALLVGGEPAGDTDAVDPTEGEGRTSNPRSAQRTGGSVQERDPCPTCAAMGIQSKFWIAKNGPRVGQLQCGGKSPDGKYLNHEPPSAPAPAQEAASTTPEQDAVVEALRKVITQDLTDEDRRQLLKDFTYNGSSLTAWLAAMPAEEQGRLRDRAVELAAGVPA